MARVADNLIKYLCPECGEQFIVSERAAADTILWCPYCNSDDVEAMVMLNDKDKLNELGCLGIYHDEK